MTPKIMGKTIDEQISSKTSKLLISRSLLIVLFHLSLFIYGQNNVRLSVETGHSATINKIIYNHDYSLASSASADNNITVWHLQTGKQYANYSAHDASVNDLAFHPEKNILFAVSSDSTFSIWDVDKDSLMARHSMGHPLYSVNYNSENNTLILGGKLLQIWDCDENKVKNTFDLIAQKGFTEVTLSPSKQFIIAGGNEEQLAHVIDIENHTILDKFFAPIESISFDSTSSSFYYVTATGSLFHKNLLENKVKGTTTKSEWNSFNDVCLTKQFIISVTDKGEIIILNKKNWKPVLTIKAHLQSIRSLAYDPVHHQLLTAGVGKKIILWDLHKKEMIKIFRSSIYRINDIDFSEDGEDIFIGFANGFVRKTNLKSNTSISNRPSLSIGQIQRGWNYKLSDLKKIGSNEVEFDLILTRNSIAREGVYDILQDMRLLWNHENNEIYLSEMPNKSDMVKKYDKDLRNDIKHSKSFFLNKKNLVDQTKEFKVVVVENNLIIQSLSTDKTIERTLNHSDRVTSVAINNQYNFVATASWDGMVKFWDLETGDLLTSFGAFGNSDFIYINDENYYFASKGALDKVGFVLNSSIFTFEQFDLVFNRPDLIFNKLPYFDETTVNNYYKAYKKRLSKMGLEEKDLKITDKIPDLAVKFNTGKNSDNGFFRYEISATDDESNLESLHVLVNGVPIFGTSGKEISGSIFEIKDSLRLTPGLNNIQFYVRNAQGINSFKTNTETISKEKRVKSNLYVATVGCSKYQQSDYNLNFADKDAKDVSDFFKKSKLFDDVYTKALLNEEVTLEGIEGLETFLNQTNENDVILLFVAGHGVLDAELDYYVASHDMDFLHPEERGIPFVYFEELLDQTRSRKKLMFIDACHSGEIDKSEVIASEKNTETETADINFRAVGTNVENVSKVNSFELSRITFADMRESNGSTVVSSSGGGEFSLEGDQWKNGIFTYALLSGLQNKDADLNQDGKIMISELQSYLINQVNNLTNGRQTPTSRVENLVNDFRIK